MSKQGNAKEAQLVDDERKTFEALQAVNARFNAAWGELAVAVGNAVLDVLARIDAKGRRQR